MSPRVSLAYGSADLQIELPADSVVVHPPAVEEPEPLEQLLEAALDAPIEAMPLEKLVRRGDRVLLITSDRTRGDPRAALIEAIAHRLPRGIDLAVAVASGTHSVCDEDARGLPEWIETPLRSDAHDPEQFVEVGHTRRGTPIRLNQFVLEADVIIATGTIRPHYFAGFGAGSKALFPGLGENESVRVNHRLKLDPTARPGRAIGNACRDDLEEALDFVDARCFLLNTVEGADKRQHGAVAGDVRAAFRVGAEACRPMFEVAATRARTVVLSDRPPIADSLYQASKMVAMAADLLEPGGTMVLAVECREGTGPLAVVNEAIYEIGLMPRLPAQHRIWLVSGLRREVVAATYCEWAASVSDVVDGETLVVADSAGSLLYTLL